MTGLWRGGVDGRSFVASLAMPDEPHAYYGAPSAIWVNVTVAADGSGVAIDLQARVLLFEARKPCPSTCSPTPQLFNKTATRLGEAHFLHFLPVPQDGYAWAMDK